MFASIRCYEVGSASSDELAELVEGEFADMIAGQPGFVWYAFLDCEDDEVVTVSVFQEREQAAASQELARDWTERRLSEFGLILTQAQHGAIPVSRATPELLQATSGRFARVRHYKLSD